MGIYHFSLPLLQTLNGNCLPIPFPNSISLLLLTKKIMQCYRMLLLQFRVSSLNWQCFYIFLFCRIYFSPSLLRICLIALQNLAQMFFLLKISMVFIGLWLFLTLSVVRNLIVVSVTLNCDNLLTSLWTAFWGYIYLYIFYSQHSKDSVKINFFNDLIYSQVFNSQKGAKTLGNNYNVVCEYWRRGVSLTSRIITLDFENIMYLTQVMWGFKD